MKKFFCMSLMAIGLMALAAGFTSCDPNKAQCWKLSVSYPEGPSVEYYFYGTGIEADAQLEVYHQAGANRVSRSQTFLSKENCHK
jgi:hypothetical protein